MFAHPDRCRRQLGQLTPRRLPRAPTQTTLELTDPGLEPLVRLHQPLVRLDQFIEPQQRTDRRLAITIQDRLRLGSLHTNRFATRKRVPARAERLLDLRDLQDVSVL